ncbi:MAG: sodium:solute symporter [Planctomycetota bacterium]|nr:MAG: sodium:solute symporter [Planctomycetota bacterium]
MQDSAHARRWSEMICGPGTRFHGHTPRMDDPGGNCYYGPFLAARNECMHENRWLGRRISAPAALVTCMLVLVSGTTCCGQQGDRELQQPRSAAPPGSSRQSSARTAESSATTNTMGLRLEWQALPDLPDPVGVAGPFVGTHGGALIVAGGANFPPPVWENEKAWHDEIYALLADGERLNWVEAGSLPRPAAYGGSATTPQGIVCAGGNHGETVFSDCFLMRWDAAAGKVVWEPLPDLPAPRAHAAVAAIGNAVYFVGGQSGAELVTASDTVYRLDLSLAPRHWETLPPIPGGARAFAMAAAQNNGFDPCIYVMGGRRERDGGIEFLSDVWQFHPRRNAWRRCADLPSPLSAGAAVGFGQSHLFILSGDDGRLFGRAEELRDRHPGFARRSWAYHTITDRWVSAGATPQNQVTTTAVVWRDRIVLPTGEIRPRVRTSAVWSITLPPSSGLFGWTDYIVLAVYLASLIVIGIYFARRTSTTEDYFRAAGGIPWWAAGCSIFATMLSSLTFTGIPSKAFAQDWVYAVGNLLIPVVAVVAVYVALPFYRGIDATSAYEYFEKRFSRGIRLSCSALFSMFHVFRMAIVMSLTALALAVATPLTPSQSVCLMGFLSVVYCSIGGVSAVIWTDTMQTVVLLGGALLAGGWMLAAWDQGLGAAWQEAVAYDKLNLVNWHLSPTDTQVALWVVVLGGIGQNVSSYTADQAVVQRYMTTPSESLAARAIWTNALLSIPATIIFFGLGTCLFLFYRAHPERLDPTITTDQVFPLFISRELPVGVAGLIVAAIFAAAQSTVSTSMNSVATTLVTDWIRPAWNDSTEHGLLRIAQVLTALLGAAGTLVALLFVDPDIRSLFDQFLKVVGLFMGVLGGLFLLGAFFPRANSLGAWCGAASGLVAMLVAALFTNLNGYLYPAMGIGVCVVVGACASRLGPPPDCDATLYLVGWKSLLVRWRAGGNSTA